MQIAQFVGRVSSVRVGRGLGDPSLHDSDLVMLS
jgi:hypothetical protein